tara:strand:+ start:309 stop:431 length:123 start_codon:yes stop_codon:yes gene_type:complete
MKQSRLNKTPWNFSCPECGNEIIPTHTRCSNCKILLDWEE